MHELHMALILLFGFLRPELAPGKLPEHPPRVVTQIRVEETDTEGSQLLTYDQPEQMGRLLTYLRLMELQDPARIDPDTFRTETFRITLERSDGTAARYRQLHREFIQKDDGPWRRMVPEDSLLFPPD